MKQIPLTQDKIAIVDDEDYKYLSQFKWYFCRGYALRAVYKDNKSKNIFMHRDLLNLKKGEFCDHINHDGIDNRRKNLRKCSHAENMRNARPHGRGSAYKGVYFFKRRCKWVAKIYVEGKQVYLGNFFCEKEAAKAYNEAAREYFGEFAYLNIIG